MRPIYTPADKTVEIGVYLKQLRQVYLAGIWIRASGKLCLP